MAWIVGTCGSKKGCWRLIQGSRRASSKRKKRAVWLRHMYHWGLYAQTDCNRSRFPSEPSTQDVRRRGGRFGATFRLFTRLLPLRRPTSSGARLRDSSRASLVGRTPVWHQTVTTGSGSEIKHTPSVRAIVSRGSGMAWIAERELPTVGSRTTKHFDGAATPRKTRERTCPARKHQQPGRKYHVPKRRTVAQVRCRFPGSGEEGRQPSGADQLRR